MVDTLFDRPKRGERALLVHINFNQENYAADTSEFYDLAQAAGAEILSVITGSRYRADPHCFIGQGKVEEIQQEIATQQIELILFNHTLSPSQERNLEKMLQCRVLDRSGLILDIFAQRAHSYEGKLQVELAQLQHLSTRLVRGWTHLERQKGGIGLRGPGETQLETDRRLLADRIKQLHKRLQKVRQQRIQSRRGRKKAALPTVSLVGYTNAGKSTLFNHLTNAKTYAADQLFATLDPTLRALQLDADLKIILADTVGFIRHLPHELVAAFHATLQETAEADLLLHVIDGHSEEKYAQIEEVQAVLAQIGADEITIIEVINKVDLSQKMPSVEYFDNRQNIVARVALSAQTGDGLTLLKVAIQKMLSQNSIKRWVFIPVNQAQWRAKCYAKAKVLNEVIDEQGNYQLYVEFQTILYEKWIQQDIFLNFVQEQYL